MTTSSTQKAFRKGQGWVLLLASWDMRCLDCLLFVGTLAMSGLYVAEFTSRRINAEANTCASTKSAKRLTSCKSGTHSNMKRRDSPDCPYKNYLALFFILNHLRMFPHQPQPTAPAPGSSRQLTVHDSWSQSRSPDLPGSLSTR